MESYWTERNKSIGSNCLIVSNSTVKPRDLIRPMVSLHQLVPLDAMVLIIIRKFRFKLRVHSKHYQWSLSQFQESMITLEPRNLPLLHNSSITHSRRINLNASLMQTAWVLIRGIEDQGKRVWDTSAQFCQIRSVSSKRTQTQTYLLPRIRVFRSPLWSGNDFSQYIVYNE